MNCGSCGKELRQRPGEADRNFHARRHCNRSCAHTSRRWNSAWNWSAELPRLKANVRAVAQAEVEAMRATKGRGA